MARACGNFNMFTQNVLRATTACTFSTSQFPKVVRDPRVSTLFTSKCASRHNGVDFSCLICPDVSAPDVLASLLFRPSGATKNWKNIVFRDFLTFSRTCIFSFLTFSISDLLRSDFLHVRVSSWLCCFLAVLLFICPYCRNFSF